MADEQSSDSSPPDSSNESSPARDSSDKSSSSPSPSNSPKKSSPPPPSSSRSPRRPEESSSSPSPRTQDEKSSPRTQDEKSSPRTQDEKSSPPPPKGSLSTPSDGSSSSTPRPSKSSSDSQSPPTPHGSKGGDNNKAFSPPPPPKSSNRHSPSAPRSLAPPKKGGSDSLKDIGLNMPGIVGIAAGAGLFLLFMLLLCVCCCRKKKKKKPRHDQMQYYNGNGYPGGKPGVEYYGGVPPQQQYNQNDHVMNVPPPPGAMGANWGHSAPPPPPGNWGHTPPAPVSGINGHSSDFSSNFSGPHGPSLPPPHPSVALGSVALGFNQNSFTYEELAAATQGFAQANLLGQGGFGYVHKGVLPSGKEVAVKSLKAGSGQGEREFQAEVEIISRVHHRHLVSLVGYCIAGGQRLLVYEFLPNSTLEFHLYATDRPVMDWYTRHKIALGSARGLAYLHEDCHPRIIHRDIKAANILLDFNSECKVADFGLAKLSEDNHTHVSTRVMGTFGYLAPEYASSGKLSEKSDVFSFGVMLLELITGRRPVDLTGEMEDSLVDWARPLCMKGAQDGDYSELVDPRLENNYDPREIASMVACAAAAVRHSARRRPKMSQIVRALEGDASLDALTDGVKPGQSSYIGSSTGGSSDYDARTYSADMKKFRKMALDSSEYASSEYGATN